MKTLLAQFAAYNFWANELFAACIQAMHAQTMEGNNNALHATLLHIWDEESIWWQRMKLQEQIVLPSATAAHVNAVAKGLLEQSRQWASWTQAAQEHMLEHEFIYRNSKRQTFKQPVHQTLLHVFNHSTQQRGQLTAHLQLLKLSKIPQTNFMDWSRSRGFK